MLESQSPAAQPSFVARHWQKIAAALIWLSLAGSALAYTLITGKSPTEALRDLIDLLRSPIGPLIYILIYTLRPLAFFSAIVVTLIGGAIWGPIFGTLYVVIGSNMSASLAYLFGRVIGKGAMSEDETAAGMQGLAARYAGRLRRNAFTTILLMRLIYLPYDLVNYLAGFLKVPYRPYLIASILGSLPGTATFVLAGASLDIDRIFAGDFSVSLNPWTLAASALLFVGGIVLSRVLRQREAAPEHN